MVAIFTGLGAGFERGSGASLGARGLLGSSALGRGGEGVFLNAATGNLLIQRQDEFLAGNKIDAPIVRTYNAQGALDDNGDYWRQSTDRRITNLTGTVNTAGSTITRVSADGSEISYAYGSWSDGAYYRATDGAGSYDKLSYDGAANVWTWTDGSSQIHESYGAYGAYWRITQQIDGDGYGLTFTYGSNKLTRITTNDGGRIDYTWSGSNITQATTTYTDLVTATVKSLTRVRYGYDGQNRLTSVTVDLTPGDNAIADANVYTTTYTYDGASNRVASITQSDGSALAITYDGSNRVVSLVQTIASGVTRTTNIAYNAGYTSIADPSGQTTSLYYDGQNRLTKIVAPPATSGATAQTIEYTYDSDGNVTDVKDQNAAHTLYEYDAQGNVTKITDALGNVVTKAYDTKNSLTLETYTASNAASSAVTLYTRYVYDVENHLRYAISAEGRVTEYTYTSAGYVSYENVYTASTYTVGSSLPTETDMNAWRDGLADRSTLERVRYVRDARGGLTDVKEYSQTSTAGAESSSGGYALTHFVYDQAGQLISRSTGPNGTESFVYDGLGRVIASTDLSGATTTIAFNDAATTTTVTTSGGYVTVSTYNKAGELLSRSDSATSDAYSATGTEFSALYDRDGRLRKTTDAAGDSHYQFYDKLGRLIGDVGKNGEAIEYRYDAKNRLVATVHYQNSLTSAQLTTLSDPNTDVEWGSSFARPTTDAAKDLWSFNVYDADDRIIETIQGDGSVTTFDYDASGRLVKTTGYANKLNSTQIDSYKVLGATPTSLVTPTADATHDQIIRSFYDGDGNLIGTLNGEGALTEIAYDGAGRKVRETSYAQLTSASLRAGGSFTDLRTSITASASNDVTTRFVYDGQGLLRYTIDAIGRVTERVYFSGTASYDIGVARKTIQYGALLSAQTSYAYSAIKAAVDAIAVAANDRVSYAVYNDKGQLAYSAVSIDNNLNASGAYLNTKYAVTSFVYDAEGRLIKTTQFNNVVDMATMGNDVDWNANLATWASSNADASKDRITRTYYNKRGEARFIVDAEGYVTRNDYNADGELLATSRYENSLTPPPPTAPPLSPTLSDATTMAQIDAAAKGAAIGQSYTYDGLGRLSTSTDALGVVHRYLYNGDGLLQYDIAASGDASDKAQTLIQYDLAGRKVSETLAYESTAAATTTYAYDGLGNLASITDPNLHVTSFAYDKAGRVTDKTDAAGIVTHYDYDAFGNVAKTTLDPTGLNISSYAYYDQLGRVVLSVDAEGYVAKTSYTNFGDILSVKRYASKATGIWSETAPPVENAGMGPAIATSASDATTSFAYDKLGRLISQTDALGGVSAYLYDAFGDRIKATDALGNASYIYYDRRGKATLSIDAEGYATETAYYAGGLIASVKRYINRATNIGDVNTRPTLSGASDDALTQFQYDAAGRLWKTTDAMGVITQLGYDTRGNVTSKTEALGLNEQRVTTYAYDKLNRLTEQTDANQIKTHYFYDAVGNLTRKAEAYQLSEQRNTFYTYDTLNRLIEVDGDEITVTTATGSNQPSSVIEKFTYDAQGNVIKHVDAVGAVTLKWYDKQDRVIASLSPTGALIKTTYDALGHVTRTDAYETLVALPTSPGGAPPASPTSGLIRTKQYVYDGLGRLIQEKILGATTASYDGTNLSVSTLAGATLTTTYDYDALGNVVRTTDARGSQTYAYYDKLGRKVSEIDTEGYRTDWTYDANGNVLSETRYAQPVDWNAVTQPNLLHGGNLSEGTSVVQPWWVAGTPYATAIETIDGAPALTARKTGGTAPWEPNWIHGGSIRTTNGDAPNQTFYVNPGEMISFSLDAKSLVAGGDVWVDIAFLDASGQAFSWLAWTSGGANGWQTLSGSAIAPAGAVTVMIDTGSRRSDGNANAQMDFAVRNLQLHKLPSSELAAPNRVTTFTYDKMGYRLTETRANVKINDAATPGTYTTADSTIIYTYNALGQVSSKTEATGDRFSYTYDAGGRMVEERRYGASYLNAQGATIDYGYADQDGQKVTPTIDYFYDGLGDLVRTISGGNDYAAYVDAHSDLSTAWSTYLAAHPGASKAEWGMMQWRQTGAAQGYAMPLLSSARVTQYIYGKGGRLLSMTDAENFTRTYRYDAAGRKTREEYTRFNPDGTSATEAIGIDYDAEGRITQAGIMKWTGSAWTRSVLDSASNETNSTAMMRYNAFGEVSERGVNGVTDANGHFAERFDYDSVGRLWRTNSGDGVWKFYVYDELGNQTVAIVDENTTSDLAAFSSITQILGLWGTNSADLANNFVDGVTATITQYDKRNQAIVVREPQRELSTSAKANLTTMRAFNAFGEVASEINAAGARIDYTYNTMGRLIKRESPAVEGVGENGLWISGYDANGAPTATSSTATAFRPTEQFYYDKSGRMTASRDANGNRTLYQILTGTGYNGADASYTATTYADGGVITTKYDVQGDARKIIDQLGYFTDQSGNKIEQLGHVTLQTFDKMGRLTQTSVANSEVSSATAIGQAATQMLQNQRVTSLNGVYSAMLTGQGELIVYAQNEIIWRSGSAESIKDASYRLLTNTVGTLGRLVILRDVPGQSSVEIWSKTASPAYGGSSFFLMRDDGSFVLAKGTAPTSAGTLWESGTIISTYTLMGAAVTQLAQNKRVTSANGVYSALLTASGELQVIAQNRIIWRSGSSETVSGASYRLVANTNGSLVIYRDVSGKASVAIWTQTASPAYSGAAFVVMQDNGSFVFAKGTAPTSAGTMWESGADSAPASLNLVQNYAYDGLGQQIKSWNSYLGNSDPNNVERTSYDLQGRVVKSYAQGGDLTSYDYVWDGGMATAGMGTFGGWIETTTYANGKTLKEKSDIFDHATGKIDLGGGDIGFVYDKAGRQTQRIINNYAFDPANPNGVGATVDYAYFNTGRIASTSSTVRVSLTSDVITQSYAYDSVGNVTAEGLKDEVWNTYIDPYTGTSSTTLIGTNIYENETASYDALNRLSTWSEAGSGVTPASAISYKYDANSNIRRATSQFRSLDAQGVASSAVGSYDYWYRYDSVNRVVTQKGVFANGSITAVPGGVDIAYDLAGNRVYTQSYTAYTDPYTGSATVTHRETSVYDAAGRVSEISSADIYSTTATPAASTGRSTFKYDPLGRLMLQTDYDAAGATVLYSRAVSYNAKNQITNETVDTKRSSTVYRNETSYNYGTGADYKLGAALTVTTVNREAASGAAFVLKSQSLMTNAYDWADGAILKTANYKLWNASSGVVNTGATPNKDYTSTYNYTSYAGQQVLGSVIIKDGRPRTVSFRNDMSGLVIRRDEADNGSGGDPHEVWYRLAGKEIGYTGNNGTRDTNDVDSIANRTATPGTAAFFNGSSTSVAYADYDQSLRSINSYNQGSSSSSYTVQSGDTLVTIASRLWGDATLWYKIAEANGLSAETTLIEGQILNLPAGVMKNTNNASTFEPYNPSEVLGEVSPTDPKKPRPPKKKHGGFFSQLLKVIQAVITIAVTLITRNPVLGDIAGQVFGMATGIQDKFSWNEVGITAVTAGVSGIGGGVGGAVTSKIENTFARAVIASAVNNAVAQGISVATGMQDKFSWSGVAAAGVSAGIGYRLAGADRVVRTGAGVLANAATRSLIDGTDFGDNVLAALPDVIGQTIGESIAGRIANSRSGTQNGVMGKKPMDEIDDGQSVIKPGVRGANDAEHAAAIQSVKGAQGSSETSPGMFEAPESSGYHQASFRPSSEGNFSVDLTDLNQLQNFGGGPVGLSDDWVEADYRGYSVNLLEQEELGGHAISYHVGKSDNFLLNRLTTPIFDGPARTYYIREASTFTSLDAANRLVNYTLSANSPTVQAVASGRLRSVFITARTLGITGRSAITQGPNDTSLPPRGRATIENTYGVGVVIVHAPDVPSGFVVVTAYPTNRTRALPLWQ